MNDTLAKIRAEAQRLRSDQALAKESVEQKAERLGQAAAPLIKAFADVQEAFIRIDVLREIWPEDYQQRPDRARGLLIGYLGDRRHPSGLALHIPGGRASYQVESSWDGKLLYVISRQTNASSPRSWQFDTPEPWLEGFYQTMSMMLEL